MHGIFRVGSQTSREQEKTDVCYLKLGTQLTFSSLVSCQGRCRTSQLRVSFGKSFTNFYLRSVTHCPSVLHFITGWWCGAGTTYITCTLEWKQNNLENSMLESVRKTHLALETQTWPASCRHSDCASWENCYDHNKQSREREVFLVGCLYELSESGFQQVSSCVTK